MSGARHGVAILTHHAAFGELLGGFLRQAGPVVVCESPGETAGADVVLMDPSHPGVDVFALASKLIRRGTSVLLMSNTVAQGWILRAVELGLSGYLGPCASPRDYLAAIRAARKGDRYFSPCAARVVADVASRPPRVPVFSGRELSVLRLLCDGCTNKETARRLGLGTKTVEGIRARLTEKAGTASSSALVRFACAQRYVDLAGREPRATR